ncbi:hypothetical protein [Enterococcus gilvus]|uniref:hypothetical protein n=1 Tax=Enterococcus gilvus TaxID=160453 RepID=UPI001C8C49B4|nr:hypothetical protein [Enterococcus gilvus]MBX8938815.1 hypothetical protein [Enterococcus gilvus]
MMKKIFRSLLLGILTFTVFSPSVAGAEENQVVQESSRSLYLEIEGVAPMFTADIQEVTLKHGETYDFTKKMLFILTSPPKWLFKLKSANGEQEIVSYQVLSNVPGAPQPGYYFATAGNGIFEYETQETYIVESPNITEIYDIGMRITNLSAGPVTWRFGINMGYESDFIDFDL